MSTLQCYGQIPNRIRSYQFCQEFRILHHHYIDDTVDKEEDWQSGSARFRAPQHPQLWGVGCRASKGFQMSGDNFWIYFIKNFCHYNSAVLLRSAARDILQSVNVALRIGLNGLMMMITTSCRRAAATICPTPLPLWTPKCLAPPSTPQLAVVSHAEYVPTLTAAPALRVKAALSKAAWWPLTF